MKKPLSSRSNRSTARVMKMDAMRKEESFKTEKK